MAREKPHINLVVVGHVDNGKSTLGSVVPGDVVHGYGHLRIHTEYG